MDYAPDSLRPKTDDRKGGLLRKLAALVKTLVSTAVTPEGTDANMALDFSAVADGTLASETIFNNAKVGGTGWTADFASGASHATGNPLNVHIVEDLTSPNYSAPFVVGGVEYYADETKVIRVGFTGRTGSDNKWERFNFALPAGAGPNAVVKFFYKPCKFANGADVGVDLGGFEIAGDFVMANSIINFVNLEGVGDVHAHTNSGHNTERPQFVAGTWYEITVKLNGDGDIGEVLSRKANGDFHYYGTRALNGGTDVLTFDGPGNYLVAADRGQFAYYKGLVFGLGVNATMPFGEFSLNAVTDLEAGQSGEDEISLTWSAPGFGIDSYIIERKIVGGPYSVIEAAHSTNSYTDSTVADLASYQYRISPVVLGLTGATAESDEVDVDNSTLGALVTDNFNREDGGLGANWTMGLGSNMAIVSNEVKTTTTSADQFAFRNDASFQNDQYAKIKITGSSEGRAIAAVRCSGVGGGVFQCYWARKDGIHKFAPGYSNLQSSDIPTLAAGDVLEIRVSGNSISRWVNGVQIGSAVTDNSIASGKPGMGQYTNAAPATMDDFEGGDL